MKTTRKILLFSSLLIIIFSCNRNEENKYSIPEDSIQKIHSSPSNGNEENVNSSQDNLKLNRKIIKTGEITFHTPNATETKTIISKSVVELNGYIAEDNVYDYGNRIENRVLIRIPADNFEKLLEQISNNIDKLDSKNITSLDVSEEFIDIESRIKTKKELENRYLELLKKANNVEEILAIEKEIGTLRTEIESIEGRLKFLQDQVSYSTLTVVYYEKTSSSFGFNSKLSDAMKNGWTNLLWFFIGIINLWPFILLIFAIIIISKRIYKRRKL